MVILETPEGKITAWRSLNENLAPEEPTVYLDIINRSWLESVGWFPADLPCWCYT